MRDRSERLIPTSIGTCEGRSISNALFFLAETAECKVYSKWSKKMSWECSFSDESCWTALEMSVSEGANAMVPQQAAFPTELHAHALFRNRYFILSKIGAGGFGSVYKAMDRQCGDRLVAIKEVSLCGLQQQAVIEATPPFSGKSACYPNLIIPICHACMSPFRPLDSGTWSWTSSLAKPLRRTRAGYLIDAFS